MTQTADDIRDAEIAELQARVKALEARVTALEQRPVFVPVLQATWPSPAPLAPAAAPPPGSVIWATSSPVSQPVYDGLGRVAGSTATGP